jgi:DNA-binding CsgD family transcriptional regulator
MADEIIGRREELLALDEFVESMSAGGRALLFEGDAGIGKTALWAEGVRLARERELGVLTARAGHSETQTSFATIGDLFAPVLDELPRLVPVQRRALEIALLVREPEGPPPEGRLLAVALLALVRAIAQDRPLLVAIDDVQWLDAGSAELLKFVLRRLEADPVGVLATVRGCPADAPLELDRAFVGFRRSPVAPLSVAAIHRLLWARLELNLPRPVLMRVHEATGGNPFFALELGRALADGTIHADSLHVALPESLRSVVAKRLSSLPSRVRETLAAVAALGAPTVTVLEPLAGNAVDDVEVAWKQGVLELEGDRIRFTHPLLAPVCYEDMPLRRRRRLHRRLADLNVDPEERARHLAIAADGPGEKIATALDVAATHARGRGAAQAAAELAEHAIGLTPPDAVERINQRRMTAANDSYYAGDRSKAKAMLEAVVASAGRGPLRGAALSLLSELSSVAEGHRAAEKLVRRALAEPDLEKHEKLTLVLDLEFFAQMRGDTRKAARRGEVAVRFAEQLGDPALLSHALGALARVMFERTGRIQRDLLDRAIEIERAAGLSLFDNSTPRIALAAQLGRAASYDEARVRSDELIAEAYERADPAVGLRLLLRASMEVAAGRWDEATRRCNEAREVGGETGRDMLDPACLAVLAEIAAHRGEEDDARSKIPALLRIAEQADYARMARDLVRALATLELSCGDAEASWRHLFPLFAKIDELDQSLARVAGSVAIEALIAIGDVDEAERLLELLDRFASQADTPLRPLAHRCRGLLHAARGHYERAIAALKTAAKEPDPPQQANPLERARTLLALGTVQRKAQRKRDARESLQRAVEIFEQLGARLWLEKTCSELRRIGGRIGSETLLSETERRIVELVVAGRRNREVAAELSLSPNTVAWNLSKVYRKLGVTSRTELAAHVAATPLA